MVTCVQDLGAPKVDISTITNPITFVVAFCIYVYLLYFEASDRHYRHKRSGKPITKAHHGIGGILGLKLICGLVMASNFANTILFFIFMYTPGSNSINFACYLRSSVVGIVISWMFIIMMLLFLFTNHCRHSYARYQLANYSKKFITFQGQKDEKPRFMFFPSGRGTWVPPFYKIFVELFGDDIEIICADAFCSQYFTDGPEWLKENLRIEEVDLSKVTVKQSSYKRLPAESNSVDVFIVALGNTNTYFREESEQENALRTVNFLNEVHRILRPGGHVIAANMVLYHEQWSDGLKASKFGDKLEVILDQVYFTYIPAFITVGTKGTEDVEVAAKDNDLYKETNLETENDDLLIALDSWFPRGYHWRLTELFVVIILVAWGIYVFIVWSILEEVEVPFPLPSGVTVASYLVSNTTLTPFVLYLMNGRFRKTAATIEAAHRKEQAKFKKEIDGANKYLRFEEAYKKTSSQVLWYQFRSELLDLALLLAANAILGWLPYLFVDLILYAAGVSLKIMEAVNVVIGVLVVAGVFRAIKFFISWYLGVKRKQNAVVEDLTGDANADSIATASNANGGAVPNPVHDHL